MKERAQSLHNKQDTNRGKHKDDDANNKGDNIVHSIREKKGVIFQSWDFFLKTRKMPLFENLIDRFLCLPPGH